MRRIREKVTERCTYITALFEDQRIPYQASLTIYDNLVNCEIVPSGFAAQDFVKKLNQILGEPYEGPRIRESFSDCGEEPGSLYVGWKSELTKDQLRKQIIQFLEKEGFKR